MSLVCPTRLPHCRDMKNFLLELVTSPFLRMAFLSACLASVAAGIVGSYIVIKRIVFISGGISHSVLGGLGLFFYLQRTLGLPWLQPLYGALLFAIISAFLIGLIHLRYRGREDIIIAAMWAFGMSLGVLFTSLTPGYNVELLSFLFGNILWTTSRDLILLGVLDVVLLITVFFMHPYFFAICFDERQARLQTKYVDVIYFILLAFTAITIVLLIQIIGAILIISMLCLPPAISNLITKKFIIMVPLAIALSILFSFAGLYFSFTFNWPTGATIGLLSTTTYLLCSLQLK